jgi:ribosomal protein S3AE
MKEVITLSDGSTVSFLKCFEPVSLGTIYRVNVTSKEGYKLKVVPLWYTRENIEMTFEPADVEAITRAHEKALEFNRKALGWYNMQAIIERSMPSVISENSITITNSKNVQIGQR